MAARVVAVALPLPVQTTFTYRVPAALPCPERGTRVVVPFGSRRVVGMVTGPAADDPELSLKDVVDVVDEAPLAPPPLLDLAAWMSEHYLAPPGECYRLVLPPAGIRASRAAAARLSRLRREGHVVVDQDLDAAGFRMVQVATLVDGAGEGAGTAQAEVVARLRAAGGRARVPELVRDRPSLRGAVVRLARAGVVRVDEERDTRAPQMLPPEAA